jgi:hypothetical protein
MSLQKGAAALVAFSRRRADLLQLKMRRLRGPRTRWVPHCGLYLLRRPSRGLRLQSGSLRGAAQGLVVVGSVAGDYTRFDIRLDLHD